MKSDINLPVNIGTEMEFSILEIVKLLEEIYNKKIDITYSGLPQDDPQIRRPDLSLLRSIYNDSNDTNLLDGLRFMIDSFKN